MRRGGRGRGGVAAKNRPRRVRGVAWAWRAVSVAYVTDPRKWVIHGERLVDDTPHIRVSLADVELPNHVRFTQYVFRMRRCAMTVVLDDAGERVQRGRRGVGAPGRLRGRRRGSCRCGCPGGGGGDRLATARH